MLAFALAQSIAETRLTASLHSYELSIKVWRALQAEALWPFSPSIREVNAHQAAMALDMPPLIGLLALRSAMAQAPDNPVLWSKLALARKAYGDRAGAIETAAEFARRWPTLPESRALLELVRE